MGRLMGGLLLLTSVAGCAVPRAAGAPLAPVERAWEVPTLELYSEWWRKTEECAGRTGDMRQVTFYKQSNVILDFPSWSFDAKKIYFNAQRKVGNIYVLENY